MRVAQAVEHGWRPTGAAKGFTRAFAEQVIAEGVKGKTLGELAGVKRKKRGKR